MGLNTDGDEMSPGSTVPNGLEQTEQNFICEQQADNKVKLRIDAYCDSMNTASQDQKPASGTGIRPFSPVHNMPQRQTSDIVNTDYNEAEEQHRNAEYNAFSATPQRLISDTVDAPWQPVQGALVTPNSNAPNDLEESVCPPTPAEIMELLDTEKNYDWDAMNETLQEEIQFCDSKFQDLKQDLPINPDVDLIDEEGYTPLYKAALKGHLEGVDDLISQGGNSNKQSKGGLTPLHADAQEGHKDTVNFLILQEADVNVECEMGRTPLHTAAKNGHTDVMGSLYANGIDVGKTDDTEWTSFNAAVKNGQKEAVKYLIAKGAQQSRYDRITPLYSAVRYNHLEPVKFFISRGADCNEECYSGLTPPHSAAGRGHMKVLEYLIQSKADVNNTDVAGDTPMTVAFANGNLDIVKHLTTEGAKQNNPGRIKPLYDAAECGRLDLVKVFLLEGADVNGEDDSGRILLHDAAISGHVNVMKYLIQHGSDVNRRDSKGLTPFNVAIQNGHLEVVKYLIANGAKQNRYNRMTPLYTASRFGHSDLVKFFISNGADVNEENDKGRIPLYDAAAGGHMEVIKYLIQKGCNVNQCDTNGWTPFNAAVHNGHLEAVKCLLANGANQNRYDGMTPLYAAAKFGHLDLVQFFNSEGADVNEESDDQMIPLHVAASRGNTKVMEYLIEQGSDVNKGDSQGWTPFNAAVYNGHLEPVKYLLSKGAKQNRFNGMTPLCMAAQFGYLHIVKFFISNGADVNEEDNEGMIPLHGAVSYDHMDVMEFLVQQGSDVNKQDHIGRTPFHNALRSGNLEAMKLLMANGAHGTRIRGMTPLYIATQYHHVDVAKHLVSKGCDVNEKSEFRRAPLHAACYNGEIDIVKYLVKHNAKVNEQDRDGWTPLHAAAQEGHREIVEFLTLYGADITAKDIDDMTPLHAAAQGGHRGVVEFLTMNGADITARDTGGMTALQATDEVVEYLTERGNDTLKEDTSGSRYRRFRGNTQRHRTSAKLEARLEDEDRYGSEGKTHFVCPAERVDHEQSSNAATTDSMDGDSEADSDEKDVTSIHSDYVFKLPVLAGKGRKDELNPFVSARLKSPEKTATPAEQKQVNGGKGSMSVEKQCASGDRAENICLAQYDKSTHGFINNTDHTAFSFLNGPFSWKCCCFDQSCQHTTETNCHSYEETEPRRHTILGEPFSSINARNDQPTTENPEKFERTILSSPPLDHPESYEENSFFTKRTSLHSEWKKKKKRRSVESPSSSFLVLVQSLLHMIIALAIILAGSPVLVAGSVSTEEITLQAGQPAVIPFDIPRFPDNTSQVFPHFILRFGSKPLPFCINGDDDLEGFKSPSQFPRFTTSIALLALSICVKVNIDPVDIEDEDMYVLRAYFHGHGKTVIVKKEILVQIPPGPAECFISISENRNYPYEVHCEATIGSIKTTITCYQYGQRVEVKGEITDNGQVTRAVFLLPDQSPFSCCSHDVTSEVNVTMCNDFEWPPSNNHISSPTVNDHTLTPSVANTVAGIGNTEQAESEVDSGTCKQYIASPVSLTIGLMIYLCLCC